MQWDKVFHEINEWQQTASLNNFKLFLDIILLSLFVLAIVYEFKRKP